MKGIKSIIMLLLLICELSAFAQRRMVAEWEPAFGTLIRWPLGIPGDLVVELARNDTVYVLVENPGQQTQATATFQSYGVNIDNCRFIEAETYSHWTRDWGPHYVFDENGNAGIADPVFDGYPWVPGCNSKEVVVMPGNPMGYEEDDAVNSALASAFNLPLIEFPAYLTGGNIMTDGHRLAFSTQQMLDESAAFCNEICFRANAQNLLGIFGYTITENPEVYGIQHIDCYAKLLDEERVIVKRVPAGHPEYHCVEGLADLFREQTNCYGRKYEVFRIDCPVITGDEVAAYTNSLILNKKVLVPLFGIPEDAQALQKYRDLMPGYQVSGFAGSWYYYDALHCRTMGIFDPGMLLVWHKPPKLAAADIPLQLTAKVVDYSNAGLVSDSIFLYWKEEGLFPWHREPLYTQPGTDSLYALLPGFTSGSVINYYFSVADSSGRHEKLPRTAPTAYYLLEFTDLLTTVSNLEIPADLTVFPLPCRDRLKIRYVPVQGDESELRLLDVSGRIILETRLISEGSDPIVIEWDTGGIVSGCYFLQLVSGHNMYTKKVLKQ